MQKDKAIQVRIDSVLKKDIEQILSSLGLSTSQAISIFLKQIQLQRGIPFDVKMPTHLPNQLTQETLLKSLRGEELTEYASLDEWMKEVDEIAKSTKI